MECDKEFVFYKYYFLGHKLLRHHGSINRENYFKILTCIVNLKIKCIYKQKAGVLNLLTYNLVISYNFVFLLRML